MDGPERKITGVGACSIGDVAAKIRPDLIPEWFHRVAFHQMSYSALSDVRAGIYFFFEGKDRGAACVFDQLAEEL